MRDLIVVVGIGCLIVLFVLCGCKNDLSGPGSEDSNLITNPSFEPGDAPSFTGWNMKDSLGDTLSLMHFAQDAPLLGGNWSLKLQTEYSPDTMFADYYIKGPADKYLYRLSLWGKVIEGGAEGTVQFRLRSDGTSSVRRVATVSATAWQYYTLEDTVRLFENDTLVVRLTGGTAVTPAGAVLFDEVSLQRQK